MKKSYFNLSALFFISLFISFAACSDPRPLPRIVIISTNDIHGAIDRFPNLATLVEDYRRLDSGRVLLVDAGDRWTGNPYVDMASEKGKPVIDLMNELGYNLTTFGNHEFDNGLEVLSKRVGEARFPFIAANIGSGTSPLPQPAPYVFITVAGTRLGFIGAVTTSHDGHPYGKEEDFKGLSFENDIKSIEKYASLRDSCDVLVALTHIGADYDSLLAMQMPMLDLIIGGHSHTLIPQGAQVGDVLVTQTGSKLRYAGITVITPRKGKPALIENRVVKLDTIPANPVFESLVASYKSNSNLMEKAGSMAKGTNKWGVMNMTTDMIRRAVKADMAFYNSGGIRFDTLPAGDLTLFDIYSMEPFYSSIEIADMTLAEIEDLILKKFNTADSEGHGIDLYPSGVEYIVITDPKGDGIHVVFLDSKWNTMPHNSRTYRVALPNYVESSYNFSRKDGGKPTGIMVTDIMREYFKRNSPVTTTGDRRAKVRKMADMQQDSSRANAVAN